LHPILRHISSSEFKPVGKKIKMYSSDIKLCARQIVKESLDQILANTYQIPGLEEMKRFLKKNFDHSFDEYIVTQKIKRSHPEWNNERVAEELDKKKRHYENELRANLRIAAVNTIEEIENLIISLNSAIREWKIMNL
jgi:hypothetical protein